MPILTIELGNIPPGELAEKLWSIDRSIGLGTFEIHNGGTLRKALDSSSRGEFEESLRGIDIPYTVADPPKRIIASSQLAAEYKYLSDLTVARVRDSYNIWLSSIATVGAVLAVALKYTEWFPLAMLFYVLPPFIMGVAWQLDGIARVRTYISVIIEPELKGCWEAGQRKHPVLADHRHFVMYSVPLFFSSVYIALTAFVLAIVHQLFHASAKTFILAFVPPLILIALSLMYLFRSFVPSRFRRYSDGWHEFKRGCVFQGPSEALPAAPSVTATALAPMRS